MRRLLAPLIPALLAALLLPGLAAADPYVDVHKASRSAKGLMMVVHGGAWNGDNEFLRSTVAADAVRFRSRGWSTAVIDYASGHRSLSDVVAAYDQLRKQAPHGRLCVYGESAGGHLALLLAARRPSLRCVIAVGAPTDLTDLEGPPQAADVVAAAAHWFGLDNLLEWSPLARADDINARVLLASAEHDPMVPPSQAAKLRAALPGLARTLTLAPGDTDFVHVDVSADSWRAYKRAERSFMSRAAR